MTVNKPWLSSLLLATALWLSPALAAQSDGAEATTETEASAASPSNADKELTEEEKKQQKKFRDALAMFGKTRLPRRVVAAQAVLREGWPDSRDVLVEGLRSPLTSERMFAVKLLGELGDAESDLASVARCLYDTSAAVRHGAVMAIQAYGKEGNSLIEAYLPTERQRNIRKMAVKTLQRAGDVEVIPFLVKQLAVERDAGVRRFVVNALEVLSKRRYGHDVEAWESYVRSDYEAAARKRAAEYSRQRAEALGTAKRDGVSRDARL